LSKGAFNLAPVRDLSFARHFGERRDPAPLFFFARHPRAGGDRSSALVLKLKALTSFAVESRAPRESLSSLVQRSASQQPNGWSSNQRMDTPVSSTGQAL
jgi:hypothetical protein